MVCHLLYACKSVVDLAYLFYSLPLQLCQTSLQKPFNMFHCFLPQDLKGVAWGLHKGCILRNILDRQGVLKAGRNVEQLLV